MALQVNPTQYEVTNGVMHGYHKSEWLVTGADDVENIPKVAPGSLAYSADLTFVAMYDGTQWVTIKGGD